MKKAHGAAMCDEGTNQQTPRDQLPAYPESSRALALMSVRTSTLAAALSLLPLGQPLLLESATAWATATVVLSTQTAQAQSADDYLNRGNSKYHRRDYQGAITDFNKAIEINPQYANAYKNRGIAKYKSKDNQVACKDYKRAVSLGHQSTAQWLNSEDGAWCRNMR